MKMNELKLIFIVMGFVFVQGCSTGSRKLATTDQVPTPTPATSSPFTVTDGMLSGRLFDALSLLKDPAVSLTADGHAILNVAGQSIDCFNGLVKDAGGANEQVNTCSFNFQVAPSGEVPTPLATLLYQALSQYGSQPKAASDPFIIKNVQAGGSTYGIKAQTGMEMSFPATVPQSIVCNSMVPYGMAQPMIDCTLNISELLSADDTQTLSQTLEKDPGYSKVIKIIKKQAKASNFPNRATRAWKSITGEVKAVTTFTQAGPVEMGRMPNSITMVINGDPSSDPTKPRVTGVYYGMD